MIAAVFSAAQDLSTWRLVLASCAVGAFIGAFAGLWPE